VILRGRDNGPMKGRIDLNADLGEGGSGGAALLAIVTSANVACGFHAGDESTMRAACREAVAHGVAIGAHVSYRDREGFGRRPLEIPPNVIETETTEQIEALRACAQAEGAAVSYLKPHGALYSRAAVDVDCAEALVAAATGAGGIRCVLCLPGSVLLARAEAAGLEPVAEAFADRGYLPDGSLVPRGTPGDLLGEDEAAHQATVIATTGEARSICVHGDSPGAVRLAARIARELEAAGVELSSFA
jgi:5-oxoprolinase (ATP-hydrolysing) subunit A